MGEITVELIRHLETAGNLQRRYVGRTDEDLCPEGLAHSGRVQRSRQPDVLVVSPLRRCLETALLSGGAKIEAVQAMIDAGAGRQAWLTQIGQAMPSARLKVITDLQECDFGTFEYKNWQEMSGDRDYQAWIDSGGNAPFPKGESPDAFRARCCVAFLALMDELAAEERDLSVRLVVHGGTIMSIMDRFALAQGEKSYYDWHVGGGGGYLCSWDFAMRGLRLASDVL